VQFTFNGQHCAYGAFELRVLEEFLLRPAGFGESLTPFLTDSLRTDLP